MKLEANSVLVNGPCSGVHGKAAETDYRQISILSHWVYAKPGEFF